MKCRYIKNILRVCFIVFHNIIGLAEPLLDILSIDKLELKRQTFLNTLKSADISQIEIETREQNECQKWLHERKLRLTASNFGKVCKMRKNTSTKNIVYSMLYAPAPQAKSLQYGRVTEVIARKKAEEFIGESVQLCGLIIDSEIPYLAASPGILNLYYIDNYIL